MAEEEEVASTGEEPSEEDVREESLPENCPKCGTALVDDEAETCPKCGADLVPPAGMKVGRVIAIVVLLLIVAAIVIFAIKGM